MLYVLGRCSGKSEKDAGSFYEPMSWTRERAYLRLLRLLLMAMCWMHYSEMEDGMHSLVLLFSGDYKVKEGRRASC